MCYQRLSNSVAGSAQVCMAISNELRDGGMLLACMHPALNFLGNEFYAMYSALKDMRCVLDSPVCHDNARMTVKCVQTMCQQVADQVRDVTQRAETWTVLAPYCTNDKLHALAISLQEHQMTLNFLAIVMASVDSELDGPLVHWQYRCLREYADIMLRCDYVDWADSDEGCGRIHKAYSELVTQLSHSLDTPLPIQTPGSSSVRFLIIRSGLSTCVQETRAFLDGMNNIERSFGHLPGSTPVDPADIEAIM
jgi:hypothetical protein